MESNNDSNRNNDIILDGRQLLPTQRHFPHLLLHFRMFKIRLLSNKFWNYKNISIKVLEDFSVGYNFGFVCSIWTFFVISTAWINKLNSDWNTQVLKVRSVPWPISFFSFDDQSLTFYVIRVIYNSRLITNFILISCSSRFDRSFLHL